MDDFARVKAAINIVDVVSQHVALKKAGGRWVGLCPFHAEKTPSFGVVENDQYFKCFGCGKGGDVFTFVQELEKLDASAALRSLADAAGVELSSTPVNAPKRGEKDRLYELFAETARLFRQRWRSEEGVAAGQALLARGIERSTIQQFGLGFAPFGSGVSDDLLAAGFKGGEIERAGIGYPREGRWIDRFRGRIVIPIRDERGRTIAFGARRLNDGPDAPKAKYLNSKDHPLFHKGEVLYGLDVARSTIRDADTAVLVEGYTDVMFAHQSGVASAVAALGTSVTEVHAKVLTRFCKDVVLFLDGDRAGREAAARAVPLLLAAGLGTQVVSLDEGRDPGDYFAGGGTQDDFRELIATTGRAGLDFLLDEFGGADAASMEQRGAVARRLVEVLGVIGDGVRRAAALGHVARELDLPLEALQAVKPRRRRPTPRDVPPDPEAEQVADAPPDVVEAEPVDRAQVVAEEELLIALLQEPALRHEVAASVPEGSFAHSPRARLLSALTSEPAVELSSLLDRFSGEKDVQQILVDLVERPLFVEPGKLFDGAIQYFERQRRAREISQLRQRLRGQLQSGDSESARRILSQFNEWRRQNGESAE